MAKEEVGDLKDKLQRAWARLKSAHFCAVECLDGASWQRERAEDLLKDAVDRYLEAFDACATPLPAAAPPPAPPAPPALAPEAAPAEWKPRLLGEIEWGRWKPAETARCTCYRFWMGIVPPPACPVHGQARPAQVWTSFRPDNKR